MEQAREKCEIARLEEGHGRGEVTGRERESQQESSDVAEGF